MRISDWSSDVCSSDLTFSSAMSASRVSQLGKSYGAVARRSCRLRRAAEAGFRSLGAKDEVPRRAGRPWQRAVPRAPFFPAGRQHGQRWHAPVRGIWRGRFGSCPGRSEEHTSELQSLMRISYAVFCLKKKKTIQITHIAARNITN